MKGKIAIACAFVMMATLNVADLAAGDKCCPACEPPSGINKGLAANDLVWEKLDGNNQEEHIFLIGFFEQDLEIFSTIFAFKYGPMLRYGFYSFLYDNKTDRKYFVRGECESKKRKISHKGLDIQCGDAIKLDGKWPNFTYKLDAPEFKADLKIQATVPTFNVGKCFYNPGKDVFLETKVFVPRGAISGTVTMDGKARKVSGQSYADHNFMNVPPLKQGPFLLALRIFPDFDKPASEQMYINVSNQALHEKFGGDFDKFIFIIKDTEVAAFTRNINVEQIDVATHENTGYRFVKKARVRARGGNFTIDGMFTVDRVIEIMDIYEWLPAWARKIAEKFWKRPVYFRFLGTFEGTLTLNGEKIPVSQKATAEMNFTQ